VIAQDPARDRQEAVRDCGGDSGVGHPVTVLCPDHEIGIHAFPTLA
jgi:hypothetical protein